MRQQTYPKTGRLYRKTDREWQSAERRKMKGKGDHDEAAQKDKEKQKNNKKTDKKDAK